ncbi:hypothetical protein Ade02nite_24680 [Paractinoplanes deccanensis]|uniref:Uncharacterized protein n=1 Tax=Paractinoplanes deccanensis TaxID=113561 RepID=A0ABQ3Y1G4_9ACTN|nr:hypothetical protein [Actinoplanes deccanensis]GID73827.1 hypothetical protein Ade02nite_24680 [Actinoplanes deccanensis]
MVLYSTRALVTLAVIGVAVVAPAPAEAHPFGDPQTVAISLDQQRPDVVHVKWRVGGPDDLTALGVALGLLPEDRAKADGTVDYRYTDAGVVAASGKFADYFLQRIAVTDGTRECAGEVEQPIQALALKGATAEFACPAPIRSATVAVRMLTDLNPAYRTLATGPQGQRYVYEGGNDSHAWTFVGAPRTSPAGSAFVQLTAVIGAILALVAVGLLAVRRVRRARRGTVPA